MLKTLVLGIACASSLVTDGASARPQQQDAKKAEADAFLKFSERRGDRDWDVSNVRGTCWAVVTYTVGSHAANAIREVSLTYNFATKAGELRVYSKGIDNPLLRSLTQGPGEFAIYFGRPLVGQWTDNAKFDVTVDHQNRIYAFSAQVDVAGFLTMFERLPSFQLHTKDRKQLFSGYSEGNEAGVRKMRECMKAGGWTPPAASGAK